MPLFWNRPGDVRQNLADLANKMPRNPVMSPNVACKLKGWAAVLHLWCSQAQSFQTVIQDFEILRFWLVSSCLKISLKLLSRKGAFHLVLAGHTYNKLGFKRFRAEANPGRTSCQTFGLSCTFVQSRLEAGTFQLPSCGGAVHGKGMVLLPCPDTTSQVQAL